VSVSTHISMSAKRERKKYERSTKLVRIKKDLEYLVEHLAKKYGVKNEWVRNAALAMGLTIVSEGLRMYRDIGFVKDVDIYIKVAKLFVLEREKLERAVKYFEGVEDIFKELGIEETKSGASVNT